MAVTRKELHILTLARMDERYSSTAGAVFAADGSVLRRDSNWDVVSSGGTEMTTIEELDRYLTEAQNEWCQTAFYLEGSATLTWATARYSYRLSELTNAASQGNLHSVEQVTKTVSGTTSTLPKVNRDFLRTHYPEYRTTSAAPAYWAIDQYTLHLQAKPSAATDMAFYGPCLPQAVNSSLASLAWMEDSDLRRVLPCLAALLMIRRKFSNENLFGRFEELALEYQDLYQRSRARLSPATREEHFKEMTPDIRPRGR
jgi:hypothetical protein